jgi:hypothetical protein
MIQVKTERSDRIVQGDILGNVEFLEYAVEKEGVLELSRIVFPRAIVLTQDCDLEQDRRFRDDESKNDDKLLLSALVAPIYNVEHVYAGNHLSELDLRMTQVAERGSTGTFLRNNERPRYHYLEFPDSIPIVPSVIDFKHYFSANLLYLAEVKREAHICTVAELFREQITQRFSNFLARIGLPEPAAPAG